MKEISRNIFGPGHAGEIAYQTIAFGAVCVAFGENGESCGKPAKGTTDADIIGDLELFPHCSPKHHQVIQERIEHDLIEQGRSTVFGRNGWGRA